MAAASDQRRLELKDLPILRRLGQGHSGYLYETEWGGKKYARKDFPLGSVELNNLFESEVQPLFDLDHPNIVKCVRYALGKSSCSLVQEYVEENLQNTVQSRIEEQRKKSSRSSSTSTRVLDGDEIKRLVLSRGQEKEIAITDEDSSRCPMPEALSIIVQIATGMKHLHENKVVHGDLKPRNVLLYSESGERKVKLADFGLSETKKRITLVSERSRRLETVTWKAPECLRELLDDEGVNEVGYIPSKTESVKKVEIAKKISRSKLAMADVYSFGLTCSYILGGKRMGGFIPKLPSACPKQLKRLIVSCLKLDYSSRPTFTAICAVLEKARLEEEVARRLEDNEDLSENYFDRPLDEVAREGVNKLGRQKMHWVLAGFDELTKCTKGGGKLHVFREKAIPVAIDLAKADYQYIIPALTLLEALTSSDVGEENGSEKTEMVLTIGDHLEYFIKLMKDMELPKAGLIAAKTVVNMLVNPQVWRTARIQHDIVSALLSISSGQAGSKVCLVGLTHLSKFSSTRIELPTIFFAGYNSNIIKRVLSLLSVGLKDKLLENLAKDTLVALDMEDEVSTPVEEKLWELMETEAFSPHSTVVGRMAIISLFTKMCKRNQVFITENLILYLLVMIRKTGEEMRSGLVAEDLKTLQRLAVELFCYCVKHERDKAQFVLTKNELERKTLEGMLEEGSGIEDESRLEILEILETVILGSSRTRITVALLVKMAKSPSAQCRAKVARALLRFVQEYEPEMQDEGAFDALMALLEDENADTRADALLALDLLSRIITIQTEKLSFQMLLPFLRPDCEQELKAAAARLLALVISDARSAKVFMEAPDALKIVLQLLEKDPTNPSSRECAHGLLKLATEEDGSVRLELASAGLGRFIKFVTSHGTDEDKALLTTVLYLLCKDGNEEDVIKAEGHMFLVSSLGDTESMEAAVRGLWSLLDNPTTEDAVLCAGFVAAAVRSINTNFASTEMAFALAKISSSSKGLDEIVNCDSTEGALLSLLERCSSIEGKGAAAAVIARLYPRLAKHEDRSRHEKLSNASSLLFKCLKETDKSQLKEFLKALAVVASGDKGIRSIHQERGVEYLIQHFESEGSDTEVRRLVLQIFAEISIVFTQATGTSLSRTMLKDALIRNKIGKRLSLLPLEEDNAGNLINLLKIIRNYSYAGEDARGDLGADAAVPLLLEVLKGNAKRGNVPPVNELAVKALGKFMEDADGRRTFLASDGITTVADVLKCRELGEVVLSHCIFILAKVVKDAGYQTWKAILKNSVLTLLKDTMFHASSNQVKLQAVDLVHLVVAHGPTSSVCTAINKEGMLNVVMELLRNVTTELSICEEKRDKDCKCKICMDKQLKAITELLKSVRKGDKDCRIFIDEKLKKLGLTL